MKKLVISLTAISGALLLFWILFIISRTVPMHKELDTYATFTTYVDHGNYSTNAYTDVFGVENEQLRIASGVFIGLGAIASLVLGILILCLFKQQANGLTIATGILGILNFLGITIIATMIVGIITVARK